MIFRRLRSNLLVLKVAIKKKNKKNLNGLRSVTNQTTPVHNPKPKAQFILSIQANGPTLPFQIKTLRPSQSQT